MYQLCETSSNTIQLEHKYEVQQQD